MFKRSFGFFTNIQTRHLNNDYQKMQHLLPTIQKPHWSMCIIYFYTAIHYTLIVHN